MNEPSEHASKVGVVTDKIESLIDQLGTSKPQTSLSMTEAIISLKNDDFFRRLVTDVVTMNGTEVGKKRLTHIFRCIASVKAGIIAEAFSNVPGPDTDAFLQWPDAATFMDVLMEGIQ